MIIYFFLLPVSSNIGHLLFISPFYNFMCTRTQRTARDEKKFLLD